MLAAQTVDREFRDQAQAAIEQAAAQFVDDSGVQLGQIDCRSSMCRIDLTGRDHAAIYDYIDRFTHALAWNTDLRGMLEDGRSSVAATIFLTRDGVPLPRLVSEQ